MTLSASDFYVQYVFDNMFCLCSQLVGRFMFFLCLNFFLVAFMSPGNTIFFADIEKTVPLINNTKSLMDLSFLSAYGCFYYSAG